MDDIKVKLRASTEAMASQCTAPTELWNEHSNAVLEAADTIERLKRERDEAHGAAMRRWPRDAVDKANLRAEKAEDKVAALREALQDLLTSLDDECVELDCLSAPTPIAEILDDRAGSHEIMARARAALKDTAPVSREMDPEGAAVEADALKRHAEATGEAVIRAAEKLVPIPGNHPYGEKQYCDYGALAKALAAHRGENSLE